MKMRLDWSTDDVTLVITSGKYRWEVRGYKHTLGTKDEVLNDDVALLLRTMPRQAFNLSDLFADREVGVRREYRQQVIDWLSWRDKVSTVL